ncbi:hypothetical protein DV515_00000109, partial [Chloebia gouldiae]
MAFSEGEPIYDMKWTQLIPFYESGICQAYVERHGAALGDFDISANIVKLFDSNENTVIQQHSILSNWCYVLPSMKMGQIINISHIIPPESPFRSYKDFQMHWKSLLCGFPVKMTSKALYATKELSRASVHEIKPKHTKLDGEMVCAVSLTQAPPRKPTLPDIPSPCNTENSHWMERLIKEPGTNSFSSSSSSFSSTGGVSIEPTEKSMSNKQMPGVPQLPTAKSLGTPVSSAFEATLPKVSKIIPIFKGKLMQMNGKITNQTDRKKKENAERHSPRKSVGVSSSMLSVHKSSITQIFKHIQNMPVKTPTDSSMLQMITGNKYLTCETLTSKPTLPVKESNMEASVKKSCARRRQ